MTSSELEKLRAVTDPLADDIVSAIFKKNGISAVNEVFIQLARNRDISTVSFPSAIKSYFHSTAGLPTWADKKKIRTGQEVFARYGIEILMVLLCKSLMESYTCWRGAAVLYETGRLTAKHGSVLGIARRLMETAQFVVDVCSPGGLESAGSGIVTIQKVRLMHAAIRNFIPRAVTWNVKTHGQPINQEDLAGTLQSFSSHVIQGLAMIGIGLTAKEQEGYMHLWQVAGHKLGILDKVNPGTLREGLELAALILRRQAAPSEQGKALAKANMDFMEAVMPGNLMDKVPLLMSRYLIGEDFSDMLGIKPKKGIISAFAEKFLLLGFITIDQLQDHNALVRQLAQRFNLILMQGLLNHYNEGKRVQFYIPPALRKQWESRLQTPPDQQIMMQDKGRQIPGR